MVLVLLVAVVVHSHHLQVAVVVAVLCLDLQGQVDGLGLAMDWVYIRDHLWVVQLRTVHHVVLVQSALMVLLV
jgi:hypothetical protein